MLDIKFIREHKEIVEAGAKKKRMDFDVAKLIKVDDKRKEILLSVEKKRTEQNEFSRQIAVCSNNDERIQLISEMKILKEELQKEEEDLKKVMKQWQVLMLAVPNIPDISVPEGGSDADNVEVRVWGEKPSFSFQPKSHIDLMTEKKMVDFERGAKVAGFRGYYLKGDGALLMFALWQYVTDFFMNRGGFTPIIAPSHLQREAFLGTGYLPQGEEDLYKTQDDTYFSGTAEVPVMAYYSDQTLEVSEFPIKLFAFSPCFRREAGSHGKDTKGLMRVHEFYKFEQVVLCEASHETSVALHEEITAHAEALMQSLSIPYHVVANCGGDLGLGQVKKYDIEAWVPSENNYRETHSASYFHDFQTRRLNIRYKDSSGKLRFAHSLNSTALALPRVLIQLVENNQQADGSITVPEPLRKYLGGRSQL
ncbi:MAG: serine--tRNA ligase [Candidatus Paceibacterota bacterium]